MKLTSMMRYALVSVLVVLVFWWGGFLYFKGSNDWQEIQTILQNDSDIRAKAGEIRTISVAPLPFMYRFSGDHARATLRITVVGSIGEYRKTVVAERRGGKWMLLS